MTRDVCRVGILKDSQRLETQTGSSINKLVLKHGCVCVVEKKAVGSGMLCAVNDELANSEVWYRFPPTRGLDSWRSLGFGWIAGKKVLNGCLNLFPWSFSMWKWSPVFTVRDLAPLSSRWSSPASERAPSPQSPARSLSSLLSSPPLPLFPLHLIFHSNPISSSSFPFSFHLVLPPTLSITVSYFFPPSLYLHLSPCPLSPPSLLSPTFLSSLFALLVSPVFLSFSVCVVKC